MILPPELQSLQERCQHSDPEIRLQAITEFEHTSQDFIPGPAAQTALAQIAAGDADPRVRASAAAHVCDPAVLEQLCQQSRHKDKAVYKTCKQKLDELHRIEAEKQQALARAHELCRALETLATKATGPLTGAQHEYLKTKWQESADVADEALHDRVRIASELIRAQVDEFMQQRNQITEARESLDQLRTAQAQAENLMNSLLSPLTTEHVALLERHQEELNSLIAAFEAVSSTSRVTPGSDDEESRESASVHKQCQETVRQLDRYSTAARNANAAATAINNLHQAVSRVSAKDTRAILELERRLNRLTPQWPEALPPSVEIQNLREIATTLSVLQKQNAEWQSKLEADATALLQNLEECVEQGNLGDAQKRWDRLQGLLNNLAESVRTELHERAAPLKSRITELQGWKNFAASEKKKELVDRMQQILDGTHPLPQRAKLIRALQDEWKKLGHSEDGDSLWAQFNEIAHKAFEPCKEYFKQRKDLMAANLRERTRICEELEQFAESLSHDTLNIAEAGKRESAAQEEWKKFAPVAQNKIKALQKRFNNILNSLRQLKRRTLQQNAERKLALIAQAEKLLELDNLQEAISTARHLQNEWKTIGPSPYKDDRNHWTAFRAVCDRIFARREEQAKQQKTETRKAVSAGRDTLRKIAALLDLPDEEFIQSRKDFAELKSTFLSQLNPELKAEKKQLTEQFDAISKKYEARHRAAPDKRTLSLTSQVRSRAHFCETLEEQLLAGNTPAQSPDELREEWAALEPVSDSSLAALMEKRFKALMQNMHDAERMKQLAEQAETAARELCIEMEIQAGADSPAQDKALRMKLQLNHLKQGFGQGRNAGKSRRQLLSELEMQFACIGPLTSAARSSLQMRINSVKAKV